MDPFPVRPRAGAFLGATLAALMAPVLVAGPASAHETRQVGEYTFIVGWSEEPAFANVPNAPEVTIVRVEGQGKDEREIPIVEDVDLQIEVIFGQESTTLEMEPAFVVGVFGDPGNYNADTFPTRPGQFSFRIFGTVEGQEVDETFTSGEETFSNVNDPAELAFPAADPANAQLAARLEEEAERVSTARTLGLIGLIVGAVALLTGGWLALSRRG